MESLVESALPSWMGFRYDDVSRNPCYKGESLNLSQLLLSRSNCHSRPSSKITLQLKFTFFGRRLLSLRNQPLVLKESSKSTVQRCLRAGVVDLNSSERFFFWRHRRKPRVWKSGGQMGSETCLPPHYYTHDHRKCRGDLSSNVRRLHCDEVHRGAVLPHSLLDRFPVR